MTLDLFAGVRVRDYHAARSWYERLLGTEPAFIPHATEAVRELAEHRYLYIAEDRGAPGGAIITIFVDDLDALAAEIASRGIEPDERVTYSNGVRKAIYRDVDERDQPRRRPRRLSAGGLVPQSHGESRPPRGRAQSPGPRVDESRGRSA